MDEYRIERRHNGRTGRDYYEIFTSGVSWLVPVPGEDSIFHTVLDALEFLESPEHPLEALAYTTLGEGCEVPTNKQLRAARDGRDALAAEIRNAEDNSWSWR